MLLHCRISCKAHTPLLFLCARLKSRSPREVDDWLEEVDVIGFVEGARVCLGRRERGIVMQILGEFENGFGV